MLTCTHHSHVINTFDNCQTKFIQLDASKKYYLECDIAPERQIKHLHRYIWSEPGIRNREEPD